MHRDNPAAVVLPCPDLDSTLEFFTQKLGFRIEGIFPADKPSVVEISGYGLMASGFCVIRHPEPNGLTGG